MTVGRLLGLTQPETPSKDLARPSKKKDTFFFERVISKKRYPSLFLTGKKGARFYLGRPSKKGRFFFDTLFLGDGIIISLLVSSHFIDS